MAMAATCRWSTAFCSSSPNRIWPPASPRPVSDSGSSGSGPSRSVRLDGEEEFVIYLAPVGKHAISVKKENAEIRPPQRR